MTTFKRLEQKLNKAINDEIASRKFWILHGYGKNWSAEERANLSNRDNALERYSTRAKWEAYKAGKITRTKAVQLAQARALSELEKWANKQHAKLTAADEAEPTPFIDISVTWARSRTWGMNPTAEIRTNSGIYYGHASGCGYDKESAAIAQAMNQAPEIMAHVYKLANGNKNIPYGANYKSLAIPYFDGGVGTECYIKVFRACGLELAHESHGETYDSYYITTKKEARKW